MALEIKETYVNETRDSIFGETGWEPCQTGDKGLLFRELQREYGRCTSRIYRDLARADQDAPVMPAVPVSTRRLTKTAAVGWYFEKRMRYEDARADSSGRHQESDYYVRGVWVELRETEED